MSEDEPELSLDGQRVFTAVTMELYRQQALSDLSEAEDLVAQAIALRDKAKATLDRAAELAAQYATLEADMEDGLTEAFLAQPRDTYDDIPW